MKQRTTLKSDTSINWGKAINFIPLDGEPIFYSDLKKMKIGDGVTRVNDLPFSCEAKYKVENEILTL